MNLRALESAGMDYEKGLKRFVGKVDVYEKVLHMFLDDNIISRITDDWHRQDIDQLMRDVHELKGVSGNMEMLPLYKECCYYLNYMRSDDCDLEKLAAMTNNLEVIYGTMYDAVEAALRD